MRLCSPAHPSSIAPVALALTAAACAGSAPPASPAQAAVRAPIRNAPDGAASPIRECKLEAPKADDILRELGLGAPSFSYSDRCPDLGEDLPGLYGNLAAALAATPTCSPLSPHCELRWRSYAHGIIDARDAFRFNRCSSLLNRYHGFRGRHLAHVDAFFPQFDHRITDAITKACGDEAAARWQSILAPLRDRPFLVAAIDCTMRVLVRLRFDRWSTVPHAEPTLKEIPRLLQQFCWMRLQVRGRADRLEARSGIGLRRAKAVQKQLLALGVLPDRLVVRDLGYVEDTGLDARFVDFEIVPDDVPWTGDTVPPPREPR